MRNLGIALLSLTIISIRSFSDNNKNIWAIYDPTVVPSDTSIITPTAYEKVMFDMMNEWYVKKTVINQCRENTKDTVFYSDSIYISKLQKLPYRIEMPYNNIVGLFINKYAERIRQVEYMVGLGESYYFRIFEAALSKYNLPLELRYLPIIESALNPRAISSAGAGGLWQFMVSTGKIYDLEINSLVDDRFDPKKSSEAAARYLSDLYTIYNDWHLVIAAYNCGPGNVARAIRKSGGKTGYWDIYPYLPRETRGYVPIFIAANYIMNYYNDHNICPVLPTFMKAMDTIVIDKRVHLVQISAILDIPIDELRFFNPQYKADIVPGDIKPYSIVLPINKIATFSLKIDTILAYNASNLIAKQVVVNPAQHTTAKGSKEGGSKSAPKNYSKIYIVKKGDTLGSIAKKHGTTVKAIKRANGMKSDMIIVKQSINIP